MLKEISVDEEENFPQDQIQRFKDDDAFYQKFVKGIEKDTSGGFRMVSENLPTQQAHHGVSPTSHTSTSQMIKDGPIQAFARASVRKYMTMMLGGDERLCQQLIPTFPIGTRRITPAPGYLQALRQDNVDVVSGSIRRFVSEGIEMESGQVLKVDTIICATGFDLSFCPRFPIVGREGDLRDVWTGGKPEAYMSVAVQGMPNYFSESHTQLLCLQ